MKKLWFAFTLLLSFWEVNAQTIQTIVPNQPVIIGNAFLIQYIITQPSEIISIGPVFFDDLKIVSGPDHYKGKAFLKGTTQPIENITYTVIPLKTGRIKINGLTIRFKKNEIRSNDVSVTVVAKPKASFHSSSSYTEAQLYAPSSKANLDKLISENLFIKTEVNKSTCFLGEAIVTTFKLYSRLQSISEVINSPSLYGFSVMDMLNVNEAHSSVETINGKVFNTSILRKIQLYPEDTGKLIIDPMQLRNEIVFLDSLTNKKTTVENLMASPSVSINVKPLPGTPPDNFSGAVGNFTISVTLQNKIIPLNEQGKLIVTVGGKGNFLQFSNPTIHFPKELDVFDPEIFDQINLNVAPSEGKRVYIFPFSANSINTFVLLPISFSYFDPVLLRYTTVFSDSLHLQVVEANKKQHKVQPNKIAVKDKYSEAVLISIFTVLVIGIIISKFFVKKKSKSKKVNIASSLNYFERFTTFSSQNDEQQFCIELRKLLNEVSTTSVLNSQQLQKISELDKDCQLLTYSNFSEKGKIETMKIRVAELLQQLQG